MPRRRARWVAFFRELDSPLVLVWDITPVCQFAKTFEALNQSCIKPLDDFDTS
jgi:hypothetical protein